MLTTPQIVYNQEAKNSKIRFVESITPALREVDFSHKILNLRHTGWYLTEQCDELVQGCVWQLPSRNGKPQYVYGYYDPYMPNCACVEFSPTDSKEDAARSGDQMAEDYAEQSREDDANFQAEYEAEYEAEQAALADDARSEIEELERVA